MKSEIVTQDNNSATTDKTDSIEQSPEKALIRNDLLSLTHQWLSHSESHGHPVRELVAATLPAARCYFESLLVNSIQNAFFLKEKPVVTIYGVERDHKIGAMAYLNMPEGASITRGDYEDFFTRYVEFGHRGVGVMSDDKRKTPFYVNLAWPDLCCDASPKFIKDFAIMVANNFKEGIAAITFCIKARRGNDKLRRILNKENRTNSKTLREAVRYGINKALRTYAKHQNVKCVYDVVYGGGELGRTTMITLAYSVNVSARAIIPIEDNRQEKRAAIRVSRYQVATRLKKRGQWKILRQGRRGKGKGKKLPQLTGDKLIRLNKAVAKWQVRWGEAKNPKPSDLTPEQKIQLAEKYGVNVHQFGSKVAHYHGKFTTHKKDKKDKKVA